MWGGGISPSLDSVWHNVIDFCAVVTVISGFGKWENSWLTVELMSHPDGRASLPSQKFWETAWRHLKKYLGLTPLPIQHQTSGPQPFWGHDLKGAILFELSHYFVWTSWIYKKENFTFHFVKLLYWIFYNYVRFNGLQSLNEIEVICNRFDQLKLNSGCRFLTLFFLPKFLFWRHT